MRLKIQDLSISQLFLFFPQTFRPKKKFEPGTLRYNLHKHAQATLNSGIDLKNAVKLPSNEGFNDWLAVHGKNLVNIDVNFIVNLGLL